MTTHDILMAGLSGVAGLALGAFFFGGLWWTVRKSLSSPHPALWVSGSMLLRMVIAVVAFYFIGQGHWDRLAICLIGFIAMRFMMTRPVVMPVARHAP